MSTPVLHSRASKLLELAAILIFASTRMQADTGTCNGQSLTLPFTDVPGLEHLLLLDRPGILYRLDQWNDTDHLQPDAAGAPRADGRLYYPHAGLSFETRQPSSRSRAVVDA